MPLLESLLCLYLASSRRRINGACAGMLITFPDLTQLVDPTAVEMGGRMGVVWLWLCLQHESERKQIFCYPGRPLWILVILTHLDFSKGRGPLQ